MTQAESLSDINSYPPQNTPDIEIYDSQGTRLNFERLEGNVIVLHFWATWCGNCAKEMERLNILQKRVKKERIIVIPISEDFKGISAVEEFYKKHNLKNLLAFIDIGNKTFREFKISSLPTTFILDASGRNVGVVKTPIDWTQDKYLTFLRQNLGTKIMDNEDYTALLNEQRKPVQEERPVIPAAAETFIDESKETQETDGAFKVKRLANPTIQEAQRQ